MTNLGNSYSDAGRRDEALKLREEVLPLSCKVLGPENPEHAQRDTQPGEFLLATPAARTRRSRCVRRCWRSAAR